MELKCVVGNCISPDDRVERCYWNVLGRDSFLPVTEHAYLDVCNWHQLVFSTRRVHTTIEGWDMVKDDI